MRIEPELLESTLLACPGVRETYTCVRDDQLVMYVAGAGTPQRWGDFLRERLPRHYWPARCFAVEAIPRNGRGKVEGKALGLPVLLAPEGRSAGDALEQSLLQIWREHLGSPELGVSDSFSTMEAIP